MTTVLIASLCHEMQGAQCDKRVTDQRAVLGAFDTNGQTLGQYAEADETYFFHQKYDRGTRDNFIHLVYGDIDTQTIEGLWMQTQ